MDCAIYFTILLFCGTMIFKIKILAIANIGNQFLKCVFYAITYVVINLMKVKCISFENFGFTTRMFSIVFVYMLGGVRYHHEILEFCDTCFRRVCGKTTIMLWGWKVLCSLS